ncbi:MAG: hypothetical protein ACR2LN_00760 [Candidatus Levyibacteriota bacterium]
MDYKEILGLASVFIALISYYPYIKDIISNKTKPHSISWVIWCVLGVVTYIGQISANAGPGAWVTGITTLICMVIATIGLTKNQVEIDTMDWLSLTGAIIVLLFWFVIKNPLLSIILATVINSVGFIPTFRKSYNNPFDETLSTYVLGGLKFVLALYALSSFTLVNILFPLSVITLSWSFVAVVIIRRAQINENKIFSMVRLAYLDIPGETNI